MKALFSFPDAPMPPSLEDLYLEFDPQSGIQKNLSRLIKIEMRNFCYRLDFCYLPNSSMSLRESGKSTPAVSGKKRPGSEPKKAMKPISKNGAFSEITACVRVYP